jgi:multidrug efflux pump subunit AcrA (membrane-fusion protein)
MMNKLIYLGFLIYAFLLGCTEHQRNGWENRVEGILGETTQVAKADTLNPNRFALAEDKQELIELKMATANKQKIDDILEAPAELVTNPNHVASVNAPMSGRITVLNVNLGSRVERNSILAVIQNPENLGQKYEVRAPLGGIVTGRSVHADEWIESGTQIMVIANYATMDGVIRLYEDELRSIKIGQEVIFDCNGLTAKGKITVISPFLDPDTRTAEARATFVNPQNQLKANAYATAQIIVDQKEALVAPKSAILPEDLELIVFVQSGDRFEKRFVETGIQQNGLVEILSGLNEGEVVVSQGAYQLKNINFSSAAVEEE